MNCLDAKNRGKSRWYVTAATGLICIASVHYAGCDSGIAPPDTQRVGTIRGAITYSQPWPPADQFREIRFVALRFVPQDTADFLQLNRIEFSEPLAYGVDADSFLIPNVPVGFFPYSGVARQATADIFSWGPIGLYAENQGVFNVAQGETTFVDVVVDFAIIPDFPDFPLERPPGPSNRSIDLP
jgi:hypothetical protein